MYCVWLFLSSSPFEFCIVFTCNTDICIFLQSTKIKVRNFVDVLLQVHSPEISQKGISNCIFYISLVNALSQHKLLVFIWLKFSRNKLFKTLIKLKLLYNVSKGIRLGNSDDGTCNFHFLVLIYLWKVKQIDSFFILPFEKPFEDRCP